MKLFTKDIDKKLFAQYSMGSNLENQMVVAKIFNPYGRGVWYLLNSDPNDPDYLWAIVNLFEVEMGSVSRSELESILVPPYRLPLERDLYFTPVNAKVLFDGLLQGKHYSKGGSVDETIGFLRLNNIDKIGTVDYGIISTPINEKQHFELKKIVENNALYDTVKKYRLEIKYYKNGYARRDSNEYLSILSENQGKAIIDYFKSSMAKGGMMQHGLKTGDKIVGKSGSDGIKIYNKQSREAGSVNISTGQRNTDKYANGGDLSNVFNKWRVVEEQVKFAVLRNIGIDRATELNRRYDRYPIRPYQLLERAVYSNLLLLDEINNDVINSAIEASIDTADMEEVGSSDFTYVMKSMLDGAGLETAFVNNSLKRVDANGNPLNLQNELPTKTMFADGGSIGYEHDVNIVTNREGENYLFPSNKEDNSMGVLLKRGGRASEVLKETDYISNRKIDAIIIDGKRYDGKSIVDGVYLRKTASGSADMPQQSAAPVVEPSKPKSAKPTRKPKPMGDGSELLNPQFAEIDAQMFERRFGVSVKVIADELKGYDKNSVFLGDAWRTYESVSGKEVSNTEVGAFYKFLLAGFSFYNVKLGKSKAIKLPNFDEQDLDNGLRIHIKPQYAKPLSKEGFLSMKNILGTDVLRPIMMGVYFDDGNLIGTDAHKLVIIKQTQSESELKTIFKDLIKKEVNKYAGGRDADKIIEEKVNAIFDGGLDKKPINFTTGMFDDGTKYPNYQAVIPKNTEYSESVSIQALIDACNGVYEAQNNCYEIIKNILFNFINGQNEQEIAFNSEYLLDTLQVLQVNGAKSVKLSPSTPTRACGIYADNGNYALIMPTMTSYSVNAPCNYSIPMKTTESNFIPSDSVIAKFKYKAGGQITEAQREKIETVMDEYGQGKLNIGLSEAGVSKIEKKANGGDVAKSYEVEYEISGKKHKSTYLLYQSDRVEKMLPPDAKIISIKETSKMAKGGGVASFKEGDIVKSKDPKDGYGTITEIVGSVALVDFQDKLSNHIRKLSFSNLEKVTISQFKNRFQSRAYMKPKDGWKHKK
jgi:hypothetical protein